MFVSLMLCILSYTYTHTHSDKHWFSLKLGLPTLASLRPAGTDMSSNPFYNGERQHFPEFSPMFKISSGSTNTEKNSDFRWSIDHLARLKPAKIETDAANLVKSNGHSPDSDHETQTAVDSFFSQKSILPSPWPVSRHNTKQTLQPSTMSEDGGSKVTKSPLPAQAKKVTFSPLPPATAFIREDSLVESYLTEAGPVDVGTQTILTFPVNFDLEKVLQGVAVPILVGVSEEEQRDTNNSSLRRKLFGKPDRQGLSLSPSPTMEANEVQLSESKSPAKHSLPFEHSDQISSTHFLESPPIHGGNKEQEESNPTSSSLVLHSPLQQLPDLSPIGIATAATVDCTGFDDVASDQSSSEGVTSDHSDSGGVALKGSEPIASELFPVTPHSTEPSTCVPAFSRQSVGDPLPTEAMSLIEAHPVQPLHPRGSPVATRRLERVNTGGSACTSTPNSGVMKRQLVASPFASPVLKHPCTSRFDVGSETMSHDIEEADGKKSVMNKYRVANGDGTHQLDDNNKPSIDVQIDGISVCSDSSSDDVAEPISLNDLRTETFELTNITATACTSYFTTLDLEDDRLSEVDRHSKPAGQDVPQSKVSVWQPPRAHSTMVDSQFQTIWKRPRPPNSFYPSLDPNVPHNSQGGGALLPSQLSTINTDSGVAASIEGNHSENMSRVTPSSPFVSADQSSADKHNTNRSVVGGRGGAGGLTTLSSRECRSNLPTMHEAGDEVNCVHKNVLPSSLNSILTSNLNSDLNSDPSSDLVDSGFALSPAVTSNILTTKPDEDGGRGFQFPLCTTSRHPGIVDSANDPSHRLPIRSYPAMSAFLPSRLKLHPLATTVSPSHQPQSTLTGCSSAAGYRGNYTPSAISHLSKLKPTSPAEFLHVTPPSRYTGEKFTISSRTGGLSSDTQGFPVEVIKKKKALKARLQSSSPIHSTLPLLAAGSQYMLTDTLRELTPPTIHSRAPVRDLLSTRPQNPLRNVTNKGYSHFSPMLLSPIRSSLLSGTSSATPPSLWIPNKLLWKHPSIGQQRENIDCHETASMHYIN